MEFPCFVIFVVIRHCVCNIHRANKKPDCICCYALCSFVATEMAKLTLTSDLNVHWSNHVDVLAVDKMPITENGLNVIENPPFNKPSTLPRSFCSCDKVDNKQKVCVLLYLLGFNLTIIKLTHWIDILAYRDLVAFHRQKIYRKINTQSREILMWKIAMKS